MKYKEFEPKKYQEELSKIFDEIFSAKKLNQNKLRKILSKYPKDSDRLFSKDNLVAGLEYLKGEKLLNEKQRDSELPFILRKKPTRTISGVTTVTVLTKPYPCPGRCIFCPNDVRMPKSYIASEPGAQRALNNKFDPYRQVFNRLRALKAIGHPTEKIELIVLGGSWSYYPENYQIWFIKECFRAMNDFTGEDEKRNKGKAALPNDNFNNNTSNNDLNEELRKADGQKANEGKVIYNKLISTSKYKNLFQENITEDTETKWEDLSSEQKKNETAHSRCVGLVLETRPSLITNKEVLHLRRLGATKIQIGVQSLDDEISQLNKRGETKKDVAQAFELLRSAGFKIHAHIMPNLYGSTPEKDLKSYKELFESEDFKPDELKIYPTSIIKNTELFELFQKGKYKPYTTKMLVNLLADFLEMTPEYCRLTRIIRDIPSDEIESGNKKTNLRQLIEDKLKKEGRENPNIRAREIQGEKVQLKDLKLDIIEYKTSKTTEFFLQYITKERKIAGFLRLSVPNSKTSGKFKNSITPELDDCSIIREIHVYGPSLELRKDSAGEAQHLGLGTRLISDAAQTSKEQGFKKMAVISSIGTREYYRKKGFYDGKLYQFKSSF